MPKIIFQPLMIANPAGRLTGEMKNPQATFLYQIMHIV